MAYIIGDDPGGAAARQPGQGKGARVAKKKKGGFTCRSCGSRMKGRDAACRRCGAPTRLGKARKAMAAAGVVFIGKAMRPQCPRCRRTSRPDAGHCTSCGSALLQVVKTANPATDPDGRWTAMQYHYDPQWRLMAHNMLYKSQGGNSGRAS
jgi:predicted amidophosphoribosyltransferase